MASQPRTYSTKYTPALALGVSLAGYAQVFSKAMRTAYRELESASRTAVPLGQAQQKLGLAHRFGLTSRQAGSAVVEASGRRDAQIELQSLNLDDAKARLAKQRSKVYRCESKLAEHREGKTLRLSAAKAAKLKRTLFYASTKVQALEGDVARLVPRVAAERTSMTFGTKKLARQRAALRLELEAAAHAPTPDPVELSGIEQLLAQAQFAWDLRRNGQFLVVGSRDETTGCQGCICTANADGSFTLSVKLPNSQGGERVLIEGLKFKHGATQLRYALAQPLVRAAALKVAQVQCDAARAEARARGEDPDELLPQSEKDRAADKKPKLKHPVKPLGKTVKGGTALTWRFMRQADDRWEIAFTTDVRGPKLITSLSRGAIGVDLNSGFLTMAETNAHGSILSSVVVQTPEIGLDANQRADARGCAVKSVIERCVKTGKPLVLERLDFRAKKASLAQRAPGTQRKLHALAYNDIQELLRSRALDAGVEVIDVDPAYTSTQGWVCYAAARGWTVHQAAAGVIARRGQGFSEKAPVSGVVRLPVAGVAVECEVPEETKRSDVLKRWPVLHRGISQAIVLHYRQRRRASDPAARTRGDSSLGGSSQAEPGQNGPGCTG